MHIRGWFIRTGLCFNNGLLHSYSYYVCYLPTDSKSSMGEYISISISMNASPTETDTPTPKPFLRRH